MAKKLKSRWITIPLDFLRRGVMVFEGPREELIRTLKEKYTDYGELVEKALDENTDLEDKSAGVTFKCTQDAIIWFPGKISLGPLVHESLHATIHILDRVDVKLTKDTEEVFCYVLEYIIEEVFDWALKNK